MNFSIFLNLDLNKSLNQLTLRKENIERTKRILKYGDKTLRND